MTVAAAKGHDGVGALSVGDFQGGQLVSTQVIRAVATPALTGVMPHWRNELIQPEVRKWRRH